jgi:hypothetical protein
MKDRINEFATYSKKITCRGIYYQPRSNLVKNENGDLLDGFHNILNRWTNFSRLLNVHIGSMMLVRQNWIQLSQ